MEVLWLNTSLGKSGDAARGAVDGVTADVLNEEPQNWRIIDFKI